MDHTARTVETYDQIAADYHLIATPEHRAWPEDSMREFRARLSGATVLVAGIGEGRDSRHLQGPGAQVVSFDFSEGMLALARAPDLSGVYRQLDLREAGKMEQMLDGIWACACLYHLTKPEFRRCLGDLYDLLNPGGVLLLNLKLGAGERFIEIPRDGYPGGDGAKQKLGGNRFYAFYTREEPAGYFSDYAVGKERRDLLKEGDGAMEFWLGKTS
ncbi:MAG: class I SAM-dependent methyltransferase [Undibacterium sp.]|nr:class I SAM-dependent methyltransferase [Opitutaceae bacterium]